VVLEAVCGEVAVVLGYEPGRAVDVDQPFKDLGFDSLGAIELRNRLSVVTGARLATTLVFDHPTPRRLADHLLLVVSVVAPNSHSAGIDKLEQLLSATVTGADRAQRAELKSRLQAFAAQLDDPSSDTDTASDNAKDLKAATDEELFALIDGLETSGSDHP
jgi:acyl carrier protein